MEGDRHTNGDVPSFVPVETILKEDGGVSLSVNSEKPEGIMMNMETRELFLSNSHNSGEDMELKRGLQRERVQALRQNPSYREMERLRQRSLMQLKRQDPQFRALERERQRARMQLRRQDPTFRALERERQRQRMQLKRRDPEFRERERAQQKTRMAVRRSSGRVSLHPVQEPPDVVPTAVVQQKQDQKEEGCRTTNGTRNEKVPDNAYTMQRLPSPQDLVQTHANRGETALLKSPYFNPASCDPRRLLLSSQGGPLLLEKGFPDGPISVGERFSTCAILRPPIPTLSHQLHRGTVLAPLPLQASTPDATSQGVLKPGNSEGCLDCS
ncbi:zinc finger CCCH domain-containing protein 13-like isoform X2 [Ornithodoros turicata]|uniref:zinc finger CCCH domain-containing protein 13-like isoform X2 n=1 Tax=Ornithodoros turicata TaxID=34597 RepID=UPI003138DD89